MVNRRAFSLVELLVTLAVIGLLVGLGLAAMTTVQASAKQGRTRAILTTLRKGLGLHAAERGSTMAPVVHPVARTTPQRHRFLRDGGEVGYAAGQTVDAGGEALLPSVPGQVANGERGRVLLAGDRFAGLADWSDGFAGWPLLYGLPRAQLTRLGIAPGLDQARALPDLRRDPRADADGDGRLDTPYTAARYADTRFAQGSAPPVDVTAWNAAATAAVTTHLALDTLGELRDLGALLTAPEDALTLDDAVSVSSPARSNWQPGHAWLAPASGTAGWHRYRHRGESIYDAWGQEVLVWLDGTGGVVAASAGRDGAFRWLPGEDGAYATPATANPGDDAPGGDDRAAHHDNLIEGSR